MRCTSIRPIGLAPRSPREAPAAQMKNDPLYIVSLVLAFDVLDDLVGQIVAARGSQMLMKTTLKPLLLGDPRGVALDLRDDLLVEIGAPLLQRLPAPCRPRRSRRRRRRAAPRTGGRGRSWCRYNLATVLRGVGLELSDELAVDLRRSAPARLAAGSPAATAARGCAAASRPRCAAPRASRCVCVVDRADLRCESRRRSARSSCGSIGSQRRGVGVALRVELRRPPCALIAASCDCACLRASGSSARFESRILIASRAAASCCVRRSERSVSFCCSCSAFARYFCSACVCSCRAIDELAALSCAMTFCWYAMRVRRWRLRAACAPAAADVAAHLLRRRRARAA